MSDNFFKVHKGLSLKPINSDPANPIEGDLQFSDGTHREKGLWQYKDGSWTVVGSGSGGGLDVFYTQDFENFNGISSSGNNSSFLGGGGLSGSFSLENTSPIAGNESGKYVAGASSNNDYIEVEAIDLDLKQRDTEIKTRFMADMSNFANDVTFVIYDKTNSTLLTDSLDVMPASESRNFYEFSVYVPATCTQISFGFHMLAGATNTESFVFDDFEWSTNPFVTKELMDVQTLELNTSNGYGSTNTRIRRFSFTRKAEGSGLFTYTDSATDGMSITINKAGLYDISYCDLWTSTVHLGISKNSSQLTTGIDGINAEDRLIIGRTVGNNVPDCVSCEVWLEAGDVIRPHTESTTTATNPEKAHFHISGRAFSEHVITPAKSTLTDWESYTPTYAGLGTVTNNFAKWRRVGDSIEVEASVNSGSPPPTIATISLPSGLTIDTNKISSGSQNALGVFAITETATSFTSPSVKEGYLFHDGSDTSNLFLSARSSADGVMQKDNGSYWFGSGDGAIIKFTVPIAEYSSDATFLAAIPVQKTAYIADVKAESANGGTFTSGAWRTRELNDLSGDTGFISLSSDQFTLSPGKYEIIASAPGLRVGRHKARLQNITDGTTDIIGTSEFSVNTVGNEHVTRSFITGQLEITSSKTYEIQHRCSTTVSGNGFGIENNGLGLSNIYTVVQIVKIK